MNNSWQKFWNETTPDKARNAWWIALGSLILFTFLAIVSYISRISGNNYLPSLSTSFSFIVVIILAVSFWLIQSKRTIIGGYGVLLAWNISNYSSFIFTRPVSGIEYAPITAIVILAIAYFIMPSKPHLRIWIGLIALATVGIIILDGFLPPIAPSTTPPNPLRGAASYTIFGFLIIFMLFYFGRLGWRALTREVQVDSSARPSETQLITQQNRNTIRTFFFLLIVSFTIVLYTVVTILTSSQIPNSTPTTALTFVAILIAGFFIIRKQYQWGAITLTLMAYLSLLSSFTTYNNNELLAIMIYVVPLAIAAYTLPPRQISFWILVSGIATIIVSGLNLLFARSSILNETPLFLQGIAAILFLVPVALILRQFNLYPFEAKVILSLTVLTAALALGIGVFAIFQASQTQTTLSQELKRSVQETAETQLGDTVRSEATNIDNELSRIRTTVQALALTMGNLYSQEASFAKGEYWDASKKLTRLPAGQYDNPDTDLAAVYVPSFVPVNTATIAEMNIMAQLDFVAPNLLQTNTKVVALYYVASNGVTRYYPNNNIATLVPANFNPTETEFFTIVTPAKDPLNLKRGAWSQAYQDQAGQGLIVTFSYPVYDERNLFRGVVSADVQLDKITERINEIKVGDAGYAMLIDQKGTVIALPPIGYKDFDFQPSVTLLGDPIKSNLVGKGSDSLQKAINKMIVGQSGLDQVDIKGVTHYIGYTILLEGDYSLGLIESYNDLNAEYITASQNLERTSIQNRQLITLLISIVVLLAALFSIGLTRLLITPIIRLTQVAERIAGGDLNARAVIETQDEIGTLAFTFNNMTTQLQDTLTGLESRVADRTKALAASAEVSRRISTILDQQQLVTEVVEQIRSAFNYYHAHIYLFDNARQNLVMAGGTGEAGQKMLLSRHQIEKGKGLVGRAAELNIPVLVPNTTKDPQWLPNILLPDTRAEAAVPIAVGNEVLGVLDIQHNIVNGLSQEDVDLLLSIANQVAVALQNTRAIARTQHEAEYESLINTITQKIRETTTVESAMQVAIRELGRATGAANTNVKLHSEKSGNGNS